MASSAKLEAELCGGKNPYKDLIKPLTSKELAKILGQLPAPIAVYSSPHRKTTFKIYKVKNYLEKAWTNAALFKLLIEARASYYRYGLYPPLDAYDNKAAVYLARVVFGGDGIINNKGFIEEWYSMRFIPGSGCPSSFDDIKYTSTRGKKISYWIQHRLFEGNGDFLKSITSISRICASEPLVCFGNAQVMRASDLKLSHTAHAFALMNAEFLKEHARSGTLPKYTTGLFRNELIEKSLSVGIGFRKNPDFKNAAQLLGFSPRTRVKIDRDVFSYRFPGYFLQVSELANFFNNLIASKELPYDFFKKHVGAEGDQILKGNAPLIQIKSLSNILLYSGRIPNSPLTGEKLRILLNERVPDGPELKIMETKSWEKSIRRTIKFLNIQPA